MSTFIHTGILCINVICLSCDAPKNPGLSPGSGPVDSAQSNLQVVFSFLLWSCKIISTKRAQQQGQEQIQDLKQEQELLQAPSKAANRLRNEQSEVTDPRAAATVEGTTQSGASAQREKSNSPPNFQ